MNTLFLFIKDLGGAYLIWLGVKLWRNTSFADGLTPRRESSRALGNFASGLAITFSNPKVIIFYGSFLPNFLDLQSLTWAEMAASAFVVAAIVATVLAGYALVASRARCLLFSPRAAQRLNRTAGAAMVAAGAAVVSTS